jgi:hypothetical protein
MYRRQDCLKIALRVMSYFAKLTEKPPTEDDVRVLHECAEIPADKDVTTKDLARAVIDRALLDGIISRGSN